MTYLGVEKVVGDTTLAAVGVNINPHMFRTAGVSTAAVYAGSNPHLGSALLHHNDPKITDAHYNRARSLSAAQSYAELMRELRSPLKDT